MQARQNLVELGRIIHKPGRRLQIERVLQQQMNPGHANALQHKLSLRNLKRKTERK
jgi:hypothetical protein